MTVGSTVCYYDCLFLSVIVMVRNALLPVIVVVYISCYCDGLLGRVRFGAAAISAPDTLATGLSGTRTFFLDSFFYSYVVTVCSSLRSR